MKIRKGFVSNSSSSSFVCFLCNCDWYCERGRRPTLCEDCLKEVFEALNDPNSAVNLNLKMLQDINADIDSAQDLFQDLAIQLKEERGY